MIEPAIFRLLISLAGRTLFFGTGQRRTGPAVPVTTVAMSADAYELVTTLALKNPAVGEGHL
jgi:hypothetical protein